MARLRVKDAASQQRAGAIDDVPGELFDVTADSWFSDDAFDAWCRVHLGQTVICYASGDFGVYHRFTAGAQHWAARNGLELPGEYGGTDWERLSQLGITQPRRRLIIRPDRDAN